MKMNEQSDGNSTVCDTVSSRRGGGESGEFGVGKRVGRRGSWNSRYEVQTHEIN
jgi:hypothetical protein